MPGADFAEAKPRARGRSARPCSCCRFGSRWSSRSRPRSIRHGERRRLRRRRSGGGSRRSSTRSSAIRSRGKRIDEWILASLMLDGRAERVESSLPPAAAALCRARATCPVPDRRHSAAALRRAGERDGWLAQKAIAGARSERARTCPSRLCACPAAEAVATPPGLEVVPADRRGERAERGARSEAPGAGRGTASRDRRDVSLENGEGARVYARLAAAEQARRARRTGRLLTGGVRPASRIGHRPHARRAAGPRSSPNTAEP